jgi:hypothetical protein
VLVTATGALLITRVQAGGIPYPVGFEYGDGFGSSTPTSTARGDVDTIVQALDGLTPATSLTARPFALAGVPAPRVHGAPFSFTTKALPTAGSQGPAGPHAPGGPQNGRTPIAANRTSLLLAITAERLRARAGGRVRVPYVVTAAAALRLELLRAHRRRPLVRVSGSATGPGRGTITWNGRGAAGRNAARLLPARAPGDGRRRPVGERQGPPQTAQPAPARSRPGLAPATGGNALSRVDSAAVSDLVDRYVRFVRSVPMPVLIGIVWVKGFVFGWLVGRRG